MKLAPFKFDKLNNQIILTNDFGRYIFVNDEQFHDIVHGNIDDEKLLAELKDKFFIFDSSIEYFAKVSAPALRASKNYLLKPTSLHIFVVTNYCNGACIYCQAQSNTKNCSKNMSKETARKAVDIALSSPLNAMDFEFQGGEPLSNFEIIKYIIQYSQEMKGNKKISYNIVTNLTLLTNEMIEVIKNYDIGISTSLDGMESLHNKNRPLVNDKPSYYLVKKGIQRLREAGIHAGAIETTTRYSLLAYKDIIDEYLSIGQESLFIRPLTPLGIANQRWNTIGYTTDEYIAFYEKCLRYIIQKNKEGFSLKEGHASIFLTKIMDGYGVNYMEARSPCGAGIGQMAYYYNGDVFTCDEGRMYFEMGHDDFKLGNVFEDDYDTLLNSTACQATCKASILESIPQCSDCVYMPYCGMCPVVNVALEKDLYPKSYHNYHCRVYMGMIKTLFKIIQENNEEDIRILRSWI